MSGGSRRIGGGQRRSIGVASLLVVDDEVGVRQMAARYLRDAGYSVVEAANGLQAWQYFQRRPSQVDGVVADAVARRL